MRRNLVALTGRGPPSTYQFESWAANHEPPRIRQIYRSDFLLDQDRAVRSANLANIYQSAGMPEVSLREAARAVNDDYANFSAHLFLAERRHVTIFFQAS